MFFLSKRDHVWTLHYEVSPLGRIIFGAAGLCGLVVAVVEVSSEQPALSKGYTIAIALVVLGVLAYWMLDDADTVAHFDLKRRRIEVESKRPWFGPPRSYAFSDIAALTAAKRSGESSDSWEAIIELANGKRIRLGARAGRGKRADS